MAPPAIAVAVDVPRRSVDAELSAGSRTKRRVQIASSSQVDRPQLVPNISTWLRSPSRRNVSDVSGLPSYSRARRRAGTSASDEKRPTRRFRSYSLREKSTSSSVAQVTRTSSVVGPSRPVGSLPSPGEAVTPTTPAFYPSPTSPISPGIPPTPHRPSVTQPISSPLLARYGAFSYEGVIYSSPRHRSPTHYRTSTWSSINSSYLQSSSSVMLPIGEKSGVVFAEHEPPTTCTPVSFDADDEAESTMSQYGDDSVYNEHLEGEPAEELEPPVSQLQEVKRSPPLVRPTRSPLGPRPMSNANVAQSGRVLFDGLGLELTAPTESSESMSINTGSHASGEDASLRRARRRGIDFMSNARFSGAFSLSSVEFRRFSEIDEVDEEPTQCDDAQTTEDRERVDSGETVDNHDFSWEAEECESGDEHHDVDTHEVPMTLQRTSPLRPTRPSISPPPLDLDSLCPLQQATSTQSHDTPPAAASTENHTSELGEPFEYQSEDPLEVSAWESDSDDDGVPHSRRGQLRRMSRAVRNSMSLPSLKSRLSFLSHEHSSTHSLSSSPESVSSLRARHSASISSPIRNTFISKLAQSAEPTLSPIPASPNPSNLGFEFPPGGHSTGNILSPPTPGTPVSPDGSTGGSFFWNFLSRASKPPSTRHSRTVSQSGAVASPTGRPPNLPLPPTPPFSGLSHFVRQRVLSDARRKCAGQRRRSASLSTAEDWRQRLTVVDPDSSMARLEMSIAKLEAYAPEASSSSAVRAVSGAASQLEDAEKVRDVSLDREAGHFRVAVDTHEDTRDSRMEPLPQLQSASTTAMVQKRDQASQTEGDEGNADVDKNSPAGCHWEPLGRPSDDGLVVFSVTPARFSKRPSQFSIGTSTSGPSSSAGSSSVYSSSASTSATTDRFIVEVKQPVAPAKGLKGKGKERPPRPPSLALLPRFDFEDPAHDVLDIRGLPLRSSSILSGRVLPVHSHSLSDAESHYSTESVSAANDARPVRPSRRARAVTPPRLHLNESSNRHGDTEEGLSSFMNFSPPLPPPQDSEPRSRVRRLLKRVNVRGLRGSFQVGVAPTSTSADPGGHAARAFYRAVS